MKKLFRDIHLWLSIPFGLIITITCFSGAMLVFEKEITESANQDLYFVREVKDAPLPMEQLLGTVAATLPDSVSVTGVTVSSDPERAYKVSLSKPRRASVFIDQYTGEVKGRYERPAFFATMFSLHRWLMDSTKQDGSICVGKLIVGISTIVFVVVLITGVIVWFPRNKDMLKHRLCISTKHGLRKFWHDLHVAGGVYVVVILLAMALTGLTWSFEWYRSGFYGLFGVEAQQGNPHQAGGNANSQQQRRGGGERHGDGHRGGGHRMHSPYAHWQDVFEQLAEENKDYKQITLSSGTAEVSFDRLGNQRASDRYEFNQRNGQITGAVSYDNAERASKLRGWIYSMHVGNWGGIVTRILAFAAALLGASLPLTCYYLWIKRIGKPKAQYDQANSH